MTENYTGFGGIAQTQDDYSVADFIARQIMNGMATSAIVEVKAVHTNGEDVTVDVQPMVHQIDGAGTGIPHGIIHGLPVFSLRGGPCVIRINPRVGDIGQVKFCSSDISTVKKTKAPANPSTRRRFDWSDGIYYGAILPKQAATTIIEVDGDGNVLIISPAVKMAVTDKVDITGIVDASGEYQVGGTKVVGEQQSAITDPTGGSTVDNGARTAIGGILSALRAHGLIAS
ncbi:Gp138 family membrane-puncturing spike protein [Novosphingobium resinovorum]|uniref:Phage protein Gp138 N-terminal domain-containing protein n=1 Tax=Novosphingobium resinovorum TaxID=158500 RepID=A0A1D8A2J3_9SPHN|nr:Gp138 family membrane-puncturing spike protein [Novosphingobium resinovorum]AOR76345.1 hypothetical protein BES08_05910 [Novosphingobium resinovorum]